MTHYIGTSIDSPIVGKNVVKMELDGYEHLIGKAFSNYKIMKIYGRCKNGNLYLTCFCAICEHYSVKRFGRIKSDLKDVCRCGSSCVINDNCKLTYRTWADMKKRCNNPKSHKYKIYGGRGIKVCREWNIYANFLTDMGKKPTNKHQIDRVDNDGDYTPDNCRWVLPVTNSRNRSKSRMVEFNGELMHLYDAAEKLGLNKKTVANRWDMGEIGEELLRPVEFKKRVL